MSHDLLAQLAYFQLEHPARASSEERAHRLLRVSHCQQPFYIQNSSDLQVHAKPILWEEIDG